MTFTLIARYTVKPGNSGQVQDALRTMATRVQADEPACLLYNVNVDPEDENTLVLYEVYENEEAVSAHRETPHFKELVEGTVVPLLEGRQRELYRRLIG